MYTLLNNISQDNVKNLVNVQKNVKMLAAASHRRRMGANKFNRLSTYSYSRYLTWTSDQRDEFHINFPNVASSLAVVKWFLHFPPAIGFLDKMTTWVNDKSPSWITSYNIGGTGNIIIDDDNIIVPVGHGITFPLSSIHEIDEDKTGTTWACVMTYDNVWQ